jgi:transposase
LRFKSGKPNGGQLGHKGSTLQMSEFPENIIELTPNYCNHCGCDLESTKPHLESRRQKHDIPEIKFQITEYRQNSKMCPKCGHTQVAEYPAGLSKSVQYGANVEALIAYLSVYQYLPFKRLKECLQHLFHLKISEGTIANVLERMAKKANTAYDTIKKSIHDSPQVGSDETSVKINGKKQWLWVWQTDDLTYLTVSKSRGCKAIDNEFPSGLTNSILNTDRWGAQLKTKAAGHQLCVAHLLRDLNFIVEVDKIDWANRCKSLFLQALNLKKQQSEYKKSDPTVMQLEQNLDIILQENIPKPLHKLTHNFQKSMLKHRDSITTFLYNAQTPPDNNGSERAVRNVKVKQKISGQFKSGQKAFCVIRSIVDTCQKRGKDIMEIMINTAQCQLT